MAKRTGEIRESVKHLPASPGVYLMVHRPTGSTYVGSAQNVRERAIGHLQNARDAFMQNPKFSALWPYRWQEFRFRLLQHATLETRYALELKWMRRFRPTLCVYEPPRALCLLSKR